MVEVFIRINQNIVRLLTKNKYKEIMRMKIVADTKAFIAEASNEPERDMIIRLTEGYDTTYMRPDFCFSLA
jgi:ABC-type protease/lipase transport system fused ATPase/permease subunit